MGRFIWAMLTSVLIAGIAAPALSQEGTRVRLRGPLDVFEADTIAITTRDGGKIEVLMQPDWTVQSVIAVPLAEMQPGDFVGASAVKGEDGRMIAEAIHYLPVAIRERAQGDIPWDLTPESLMINADIAEVTAVGNGQIVVKMAHKDATYDLVIAPDTPIVKYGDGDKSQLVPGAAVYMSARHMPDGTYTATRVRAETNGVKPPL